MTAKLTQLQEAFCLSYLESGDATQAYRAHYNTAKMKDTTVWPAASKMLNKPNVAARIQELRAAVAEKAIITEAYVLATIKETIERCRQVAPVLDRKGNQVYVVVEGADGDKKLVPAFTFDPASVLKGSELLGKYKKMFSDRTEHTGADGKPIEVKTTLNIVFKDPPRA